MSDTTMPDAMATLRAKYPEYNSIGNADLAAKVIAKYPQYQQALGGYLSSAPPAPKPLSTAPLMGSQNLPTLGQPPAVDPQAVTKFRTDFFNTLNPNANIPMQTAQGLAKNPNDPASMQRLSLMSPVAQAAIRQKAQEIASAPVFEPPTNNYGMPNPGTYRDPQSGARTAIPQPHDIIGTMLHGPEGYRQLQSAQGALPELTRVAESSLDPANLLMLIGAGGLGAGAYGAVGSFLGKAGIAGMMGQAGYEKAKQGDYGGAAVDAAMGLLPFAEHPLSRAVDSLRSPKLGTTLPPPDFASDPYMRSLAGAEAPNPIGRTVLPADPAAFAPLGRPVPPDAATAFTRGVDPNAPHQIAEPREAPVLPPAPETGSIRSAAAPVVDATAPPVLPPDAATVPPLEIGAKIPDPARAQQVIMDNAALHPDATPEESAAVARAVLSEENGQPGNPTTAEQPAALPQGAGHDSGNIGVQSAETPGVRTFAGLDSGPALAQSSGEGLVDPTRTADTARAVAVADPAPLRSGAQAAEPVAAAVPEASAVAPTSTVPFKLTHIEAGALANAARLSHPEFSAMLDKAFEQNTTGHVNFNLNADALSLLREHNTTADAVRMLQLKRGMNVPTEGEFSPTAFKARLDKAERALAKTPAAQPSAAPVVTPDPVEAAPLAAVEHPPLPKQESTFKRTPAEPRPAPGPDFNQTKIANAHVEEQRALFGVDPLPDAVRRSHAETLAHVMETGMHEDALNVAHDVLKTGRAMSPDEVIANNLRQHQIKAKLIEVNKQIRAGVDAGQNVDGLKAQYDALRGDYETLGDADGRAGTISAQALGIRKAVVDDYTHPNIVDRMEMARPEVPLNPKEHARVNAVSDALEKVEAKQADLDAKAKPHDEAQSQAAAEKAVAEMKPKAARSVRQELRADQKAKLDTEFDGLKDKFVKATSQLNAGVDPAVVPILRDMAKNRVQSGALTVADVVDALHEAIKEHMPEVTKRDVRDAISGYGQGSKIPRATKLADLKEQMRLLSQIEDVNKPAATRTPRPVSPEVKGLREDLSAARAEGKPPVKPTSDAMKLERYKTQLKNKIEDYDARIKAGDFSADPKRSPLALDPDAVELKSRRDALKAVYDNLDPAKHKTSETTETRSPEEIVQARLEAQVKNLREKLTGKVEPVSRRSTVDNEATAGLKKEVAELRSNLADRQKKAGPQPPSAEDAVQAKMQKRINAIEEKVKSGNVLPGKKPQLTTVDTPSMMETRRQLESAEKQLSEMQKAQSPPTDPLKGYKTRLANDIADLQKQVDTGAPDAPKPKVERVYDAQTKALQEERARLRAQVDQMVNTRTPKSALEKYAAYHRFALLSRVGTLGKLGAAAFERVAFSPLEELGGAAMKTLMPGIAEKAPHGTPSLRAEGAALKPLFQKSTYADALQKGKTGMNSLDALYGDKADHNEAPTVLNFPGRLHGMIKTPAQISAFERSMVKQETWAKKQGLDTSDPATVATLHARAYQESLNAILMQNNTVTNLYKGVINDLEHNQSAPKAGKVAAAVLRTAMPIVKIPTNFAGEHALGLPFVGAGRAAYEVAVAKGVKNLTPKQADVVVRALKKQAIGTALFALGYFNSDKIGGYYQQGKEENGLKPGSIKVFGHDVPHMLLHSPQMEAITAGGAFRQAMDADRKKQNSDTLSRITSGMFAVGKGQAESIPFVDAPSQLARALESKKQAGIQAGNQVASMVVPGALPEFSSWLDKTPRKPGGFGDALKMGSGLRSLVPARADK